jgi:hypothetical protein
LDRVDFLGACENATREKEDIGNTDIGNTDIGNTETQRKAANQKVLRAMNGH